MAYHDPLSQIRSILKERGITDEEIDQALVDNTLDLITAQRLILPSKLTHTRKEICQITGMPIEQVRRFWRALGFPDISDDKKAFTDSDIEAIDILQGLLNSGLADQETALQLARVLGQSLSRIAEAEVTIAGGFDTELDNVASIQQLLQVADNTLPAIAKLLEFVWRRHLAAAVERAMLIRSRHSTTTGGVEMAVGFADMVGFTALSQQISIESLAEIVSHFEALAQDITSQFGGRVVKMIGDEAMFVVEEMADAARIALALSEAYAADELLSDVRIGLSAGPVLLRDGDYYGPVVNLANRIVALVEPGGILVSSTLYEALADNNEFSFIQLKRSRYLKDIGKVELWALFTPGSEGAGRERRQGVRWERLSELLPSLTTLSTLPALGELRGMGERFIEDVRTRGLEPPPHKGTGT